MNTEYTDDGFIEVASKDPTWNKARELVSNHLRLSGALTSLIRKAWAGRISIDDFTKQSSMVGISPECIIQASEIYIDPELSARDILEQAVTTLGVKASALVLATQASIISMLITRPRVGWKNHCQHTINDLEIGYKLGARVGDIGIENGMLMGLAYRLGLGLMLSIDPESYQKYRASENNLGIGNAKLARELFGCEHYQLSALAVQTLGFGHHTAFGIALGLGEISPQHISIPKETLYWRAGMSWVCALAQGRNYPANLDLRYMFSAIAPAKENQPKNLILEQLYTEISKIRSKNSAWIWHIPAGSYDELKKKYNLEL